MAPLTSASAPSRAIVFVAAIVCCVYLVSPHRLLNDHVPDNIRPRIFQDNDDRVAATTGVQKRRPTSGFLETHEELKTRHVRCYKTMCTCFNNTADCSNNGGNLTFIPKLNYSRPIQNLWFTNNRLRHIPKGFFKNVSGVTTLHLQGNGLSLVSPGAFDDLPKLYNLILDQNSQNYTTLLPVFSSARKLGKLLLRQMNLGTIPCDYFHRHPLPNLYRLDLSGNYLKHLNFSTFKPLKGLAYLYVQSCRIYEVTSDTMPRLKELGLQNNALYDFPTTCAGNGSSLFPNLSLLDFAKNKFVSFKTRKRVCLPRLKKLSMNRNDIEHIQTDTFGEKRFPELLQIDIDDISRIKQIDKFAFRNPSLRVLSLFECNIQFSSVLVSPQCFAGIPNLSELMLSHNFMTGVSDSKIKQLLRPVRTSLQNLYLGQCQIRSISRDTFAELRNLSGLYLYRNSLDDIPDGAFDSLSNLKELTLSLNQLTTVRESLFSSTLQNQMTRLDLSGNPFQCDCDLLWFQRWYLKSPSLFYHTYANYTCTNAVNTTLSAMVVRQEVCFISREAYTAIIACSAVSILLLLFTSVVYNYRWAIRLKLAFRGRGDALRRRLREEPVRYDVLVVCADEDAEWLDPQLIDRLEGGLGLRLHLYERDGHPGKSMLQNTEDGVKAASKFMVVFSKGFAQDPRCQFQLDVCLHQTLDYDDALIVTCLGDVTPRDLTDTMVAVLNTTAYIRWGEGEGGGEGEGEGEGEGAGNAAAGGTQRVFWDRLKLCLREALPQAP